MIVQLDTDRMEEAVNLVNALALLSDEEEILVLLNEEVVKAQITQLAKQLGTCPRCGLPEQLDADIRDGKVRSAVATCAKHNYGRVLLTFAAAWAAMG